jgi:hydrogenase maturation protein HypF
MRGPAGSKDRWRNFGNPEERRRNRFLFKGIVQGVGFRPFIYRTATLLGLGGFVQNRGDGVVVEVEGPAERLAAFLPSVTKDLPPLARISEVTEEALPASGLREISFHIVPSVDGRRGDVHISPDTATCADCLRELFDPADRRYRYPFINCTHCGPRLTIIRDIPYDREKTSMDVFPLCPDCRKEYENPEDRRFHAEPNACPRCGPRVRLLDGTGTPVEGADPIPGAARLLREGRIVAVKGLGGYHLAVDGANDEAVRRLRFRKCREDKPLALMVRDLEAAQRIACLSGEDRDLLLSPARPIVLVPKKEGAGLSESISPGVSTFGIMLPYTPIHHLLLREPFRALVMTSGNRTDEPICIRNGEAVSRLAGIADAWLDHDREILVRCDDSVAAVFPSGPTFLRRSRGYAPAPVRLEREYPSVLALGPHLKSTLCILKGRHAFLSPHIGDLATPQARDFHREALALMERITECRPAVVARDLHPGYYSTLAAESLKRETVIPVQHHHAHIVSAMADNGLSGEVIGLSMDGTGYGTDGRIWGCEFLAADEEDFRRLGHHRYFPLPGGEAAIREPWRIVLGMLWDPLGKETFSAAGAAGILPPDFRPDLYEKILTKKLNSPEASSLGRVFDGAAAALGIRRKVAFEGQAAMELEGWAAKAEKTDGRTLPYAIDPAGGTCLLDLSPVLPALMEGRKSGEGIDVLALSFHRTVIEALLSVAVMLRESTGLDRVVLSGGCFQNRILLSGLMEKLDERGFGVYFHRRVPTNDGGIALGQAVVAGARMKRGGEKTGSERNMG